MWASQPNWTDAQLKAIIASVLVVDGDRDEPINREHTEYRFNTENSIYYFGRLFKADPLPPVSSFLFERHLFIAIFFLFYRLAVSSNCDGFGCNIGLHKSAFSRRH
jgi:hypothetical protein